MFVRFTLTAELEFKDAVDYYNDQSEGLGYDFANEVNLTIHRILEYVDSWPSISENMRRARTNRFPYGIIYTCENDMILITAVMHLHRHPDYWKDRI